MGSSRCERRVPYRIYSASPTRFNVGHSFAVEERRRRRRESPVDATPRRRHPHAFPSLRRRHIALAGRSSPPAAAIRVGRGARGLAPASRAEAPPRETKSPPALPEAAPEAAPSSPGRKPEVGGDASVLARTGGAGRHRSAAEPTPLAAVRRSPARAARRTLAVATRAGVPAETASASRGPLGAVSSQERRGGTRAPAGSRVVFARGRASTPERTTEMAPRTWRAGLEGRGAEALSPTELRPRHRKQNKDERSQKRRRSGSDASRTVALSCQNPERLVEDSVRDAHPFVTRTPDALREDHARARTGSAGRARAARRARRRSASPRRRERASRRALRARASTRRELRLRSLYAARVTSRERRAETRARLVSRNRTANTERTPGASFGSGVSRRTRVRRRRRARGATRPAPSRPRPRTRARPR